MRISGDSIEKAINFGASSLSEFGSAANKAGVAGARKLGLKNNAARIGATALTTGLVGGMAGQALGTTMNIDDGFGEMVGGSICGLGLGAVSGAGIGAVAAAIAKGKR